MSLLSKDALLSVQRRTCTVPIPQAGEGAEILLAEMTLAERQAYAQQVAQHQSSKTPCSDDTVLALLLTFCLRDAHGALLATPEDAPHLLAQLPAQLFERLAIAAVELNQCDGARVAQEKKDSETTPSCA